MLQPINKKEELIMCKNCRTQLDTIVESGLFSNEEITILHNPARVINVNFPVTMDDGVTRLVSGFRVQYNDALGPTKGGIRIHPNSSLEEVSELAFLMSLKTALIGVPYGGAKGAIKIDPKVLSKSELERTVRGYTKAIAKFIGSDFDIPAPDVNTGPREMAWIRDEYEKIVGHSEPAVVTGKSIENDGSLGRDTATALGGFYIIQEHLSATNKQASFQEITVAIQGFGNVGGYLAEFLHEAGFKVVAVSDSGTGLYNPNGLPIKELRTFKKKRGKFSDRSEEKISNEKLLGLPVDILIPSALGEVITEENVDSIQAKTIIEMANAPTTPEASLVLRKKSVAVIPDILANAGGVLVSYFEWRQNLDDEKWSLDDVNDKLKTHMVSAYDRVAKESSEKNISMRNAAFSVAIRKILEAENKRSM